MLPEPRRFHKMSSSSRMDIRTLALTGGVAVVAITHSTFIVLSGALDQTQKRYHAIFNLAAAGAIVFGSRLLG